MVNVLTSYPYQPTEEQIRLRLIKQLKTDLKNLINKSSEMISFDDEGGKELRNFTAELKSYSSVSFNVDPLFRLSLIDCYTKLKEALGDDQQDNLKEEAELFCEEVISEYVSVAVGEEIADGGCFETFVFQLKDNTELSDIHSCFDDAGRLRKRILSTGPYAE